MLIISRFKSLWRPWFKSRAMNFMQGFCHGVPVVQSYVREHNLFLRLSWCPLFSPYHMSLRPVGSLSQRSWFPQRFTVLVSCLFSPCVLVFYWPVICPGVFYFLSIIFTYVLLVLSVINPTFPTGLLSVMVSCLFCLSWWPTRLSSVLETFLFSIFCKVKFSFH